MFTFKPKGYKGMDAKRRLTNRHPVTLKVKKRVLYRAQAMAKQYNVNIETVLEEWLTQYADELPVEMLSDKEVLALCHYELHILQQQELTNLLHTNRENDLTHEEQIRLDELLQFHRRGLIRKARAIQVALMRGLISSYQ